MRGHIVGSMAGFLACVSLLLLSALGSANAADPVKLNAELVMFGNVTDFETSADGLWVVYRADQEVDGIFGVYSVPAGGGAAVKLNDPGIVRGFRISGDSAHVVYRVGPLSGGRFDLFSVPIAGGTPVRLNDDETSAVTASWGISADGAWVVFYAHRGVDWDPFCRRHFAVATPGGPLMGLTGCPYAGDPYVSENFRLSPDGQRFVVTYPNHGYFDATLISRLLGGTGTTLSSAAENDEFVISPDSQHVAFATGTETDSHRLMTRPIGGGSSVELDPTWINTVCSFSPVPVGGQLQVVYSVGSAPSLFSVAIDGSTSALLTPMPLESEPVVRFTSDGARVVYQGREGGGAEELYSVDTLGGTPITLNGALPVGGRVASFELSPDGATAVYRADETAVGVHQLYSVPVTGGVSERLNDDLVEGSVEDDYAVASDGLTVVYRAAQEPPGTRQIYEVLTGGGIPVRLNGELATGGSCLEFKVSGDGRRVVYRADAETAGVVELLSVRRVVACPLDDPLDNDGICPAFDNCPADANPGQSDTDGDGAGDVCDCAPADPGVRPPGEVGPLTLTRAGFTAAELSWPSAVGADFYSIHRGLLSALTTGSYGDCLAEGLPAGSFADTEPPPQGDGFTYLLQAESSACGLGPLGASSSGLPRINDDPGACSGQGG